MASVAAVSCRTVLCPGVAAPSDGGHFYPGESTAAPMHDPYWLEDDDILACVPLEASGEEEELTTAVPPFCDMPLADTATWKGHWGPAQDAWAPLQIGAAFPNPFQVFQQQISPGCASPDDLTAATGGCWAGAVGALCSAPGSGSQAASSFGLWVPCKTDPVPDLPLISPVGHITTALRMHSADDLDAFSASTSCTLPQHPLSMPTACSLAAARTASNFSEQELQWSAEAWPEPASPTQPGKKRGASAAACTSPRQASRRGGKGSPASGLERSREIQRNYLQRKRGKVDALHVHLNNLRELKAQLEESVAPLLKEYVAHTSGFSLHQMQEEAKFLASIGTGVPAVLAALDKAMGNAHTPPSVLLTLLAEAAQLDTHDSDQGAAGVDSASPQAIRSLVAKLRMTKKQRDVLVEQTKEARKQVIELRSERSGLAMQLQGLATRWVDASTMPWLSASVSAHLIAGQLCGLASREHYLLASLLLACLAAVRNSDQALLSDSVVAMRMDVHALCLEMINAPKAPGAGHA